MNTTNITDLKTIQLVVKHGYLAFPHGGASEVDGKIVYDCLNEPTTLTYAYPAGDWDTIKWPLPRAKAKRERALEQLAGALFDERECNPHFPVDATITLPDGSEFDFDLLVK